MICSKLQAKRGVHHTSGTISIMQDDYWSVEVRNDSAHRSASHFSLEYLSGRLQKVDPVRRIRSQNNSEGEVVQRQALLRRGHKLFRRDSPKNQAEVFQRRTPDKVVHPGTRINCLCARRTMARGHQSFRHHRSDPKRHDSPVL